MHGLEHQPAAQGPLGLCIYCFRYRTSPDLFNTEHVLPRCSSPDVAQQLVLRNLVCVTCNRSFSQFDALSAPLWYPAATEIAFTREPRALGPSPRFGQKACPGLAVTAAPLHLLRGATFQLIYDGREYGLRLATHVVIRAPYENGWRHMDRNAFWKYSRANQSIDELFFLHRTKNAHNVAQQARELGARLFDVEDYVQPLASEAMIASLAAWLRMGITKVAFNYFAWVASKSRNAETRAVPYSKACDDIGNFIVRREHHVVDHGAQPIYVPQDFWTRQVRKHWIFMRKESSAGTTEVVVYLKLYETVLWRVVIARNVNWELPTSEHEWNFEQRRCVQKLMYP